VKENIVDVLFFVSFRNKMKRIKPLLLAIIAIFLGKGLAILL